MFGQYQGHCLTIPGYILSVSTTVTLLQFQNFVQWILLHCVVLFILYKQLIVFLNIRMSLTGVNCLVYMYWSSTVIVEYLQNILKCKLPFEFIKLTKKGGVSKE